MKPHYSIRTVRLSSGGEVTLEVRAVDFFKIARPDRALVFGLVDSMDAYERVQRFARRRRRNAQIVKASDLGGEA